MAEFVRIWDELAEVYVEYDITVEGGAGSGTGGTGTTIPVTPLNISSNVNTGVINKVIDTNDITASINSVDIAQIFRPVVIEKSSANRFTIQANVANQISVLARRDNLIVNTSGIGIAGAQGEKGEDSIIKFNANSSYSKGTIVIFDGKIWISQSRLYGGITPIANPAENEFWSQIADQKYVDFLPLTSGYEVASQEEWDAIENTVELGDIIRVSNSAVDTIDIGTVNTDTEYTISDVGRALQDSSGRQYFITQAFGVNEKEIRATNREAITASDFREALTLAGVVYEKGNLSGLNTPLNVGAEFANDSNNVFQITEIVDHTSTSLRVTFYPIAGSGPINVGFLSNTSPNVIGNKIYSGANPGVEISEAITNLVVGNRLHVVGEESSTTQNITKIEIVGGKTYFDIADYVGYDTGDKVIGRSISNETLVAGQWYVRNSNTVDKLRLDAIGPDVVLRADVSSLQNNFPTLTTNPSLVTASTRDRATAFFSKDGLDEDGKYNQTAIPFTRTHVSTLRFLLLKEIGGRFDSSFSDPTDQEAQDLVQNGGLAFPETDHGAQQNFVDAVIENDQNLQITTTTQSVTNGLDIEIKTLSSNAEVNVVKSVNQTDTDNDPSGLKISGAGALSLDSTNTGGDGQGNKVIRLRSDGLIPPSVFGQVNLSATETFETTTDRNASTSRLLKMGDVAIITGDPAATDPFIGTFVFQSMDQTEALGSQNSDWIEIVTPTGAVASVAGKSGVVTLAIEDIGTGTGSLTTALSNKLDSDQVSTTVPANAVFTDTTYDLKTSAITDGVEIKLDASTGSDTTQEIIGGTNVTVVRTDDDTITINSTDTNSQLDKDDINALDIDAGTVNGFTVESNVPSGAVFTDNNDNTTYELTTSSITDGVEITLDGSDGADTKQEIMGGTNVTVVRTDSDTITISSTDTNTQLNKGQVRSLFQSNDNTNIFTDNDETKLDNINVVSETSVTDGTRTLTKYTDVDARDALDISDTNGILTYTDSSDDVQKLDTKTDISGKQDTISSANAESIRSTLNVSDGADVTTEFSGQTTDGNYTVPVRDSGATDTKFLREDSDWAVPIDTQYVDAVSADNTTDPVTPAEAGLLSINDKNKLDGIESGATKDQDKSDIEGLNISYSSLTETPTIPTVPSGTTPTNWTDLQNTLTAGTGIGIDAANVISVQNASGIQVTAFAFEKVDGDTLRITKFENGDTINPADYEGAQFVIVDALDTELYNIAGTCSVADDMGNVITNAQECQNTFSGTWTINSGPAILQRIS